MRTTPAQVRKAMKALGLLYDIEKVEGSWYVVGGDSLDWRLPGGRCLYASGFDGLSADEWATIIAEKVEDGKKSMRLGTGGN